MLGEVAPDHFRELLEQPGAVMVEPYGKVVFYGDVQTAATKARNSTL